MLSCRIMVGIIESTYSIVYGWHLAYGITRFLSIVNNLLMIIIYNRDLPPRYNALINKYYSVMPPRNPRR